MGPRLPWLPGPTSVVGPEREEPEDDNRERPESANLGAAEGGDGMRPRFALRLGFRQVKGLREEEMAELVARRGRGYADLADLRRRAGLSAAALDRLARADAFTSLELDRRGALWRAIGLDRTGHELDPPPLFAWARDRPAAAAKGWTASAEPEIALPRMTLGHEVAEDYANLRMSLRAHPLALLRPMLDPRIVRAERLARIPNGRTVEVAGLTLVRQRPGTASGVIFITLEDESGIANLVVWPKVFERFRRVVLGAQLLVVRGPLQKEGLVIHVIAERLIDRTDLLRRLAETDQALTAPLARADEVKRPGPPDPRDPFFRPRDLDHFRTHPHIYRGILEPPEARSARGRAPSIPAPPASNPATSARPYRSQENSPVSSCSEHPHPTLSHRGGGRIPVGRAQFRGGRIPVGPISLPP